MCVVNQSQRVHRTLIGLTLLSSLFLTLPTAQASCMPKQTTTSTSIRFDMTDILKPTGQASQNFRTQFSSMPNFTCTAPGWLKSNKVGITSTLKNQVATIGFNSGKQVVEVRLVSLETEEVKDIPAGSNLSSMLDTNFTLSFKKLSGNAAIQAKKYRSYHEVTGKEALFSPVVIASDITELNFVQWLIDMTLKVLEFLLTWHWPVDEHDIFLQPITLVFDAYTTTCAFTNSGLVVNLPKTNKGQLMSSSQPGYTPFHLDFACKDLPDGNKSSRGIKIFLASKNLHATDKTLLINNLSAGVKGVGFKLVKANDQSKPITLSETESAQGNATSLFSVKAYEGLTPSFSINLGTYYYVYDKQLITTGKLSSSATVVLSYE